jgi:hypothetical protein
LGHYSADGLVGSAWPSGTSNLEGPAWCALWAVTAPRADATTWLPTVVQSTRCGGRNGMSNEDARASHWARRGGRGLTEGLPQWRGRNAAGVAASRGGASSPVDGGGSGEILKLRKRE